MKKPNGTYKDEYQALRAARRARDTEKDYRTFYAFETEYGWGFVFHGSFGHEEIRDRRVWDSSIPVKHLSGPVYT